MSHFARRRSLVLAAIATPFTMPTFASNQKISAANNELEKLEASANGRLGVAAINTGNGMRVQYRADERFPFCSTFKTIVAAAILQKSATDKGLLAKRIHYNKDELVKSGYAPITQKYIADGMTIAELCAATLQYSDNAAANFLMKELGGPAAVTAYARSIGDDTFRLDRWEPELNSAIPCDERDTTTSAAMEKSLQQLMLGDALAVSQRVQLVAWLKGNTTGGKRMLAGVPKDWIVGDKTGTGSYGTTNDAGVLWPVNGAPIVAVVYFTQNDKTAAPRDDVIAAATRIVIAAFNSVAST
ncbi:class A beta-lactamase [Herminiimonas fonticola]|uniref:Beta-lactamase n=1 Tax=Herminiimonas fonticola TaxID=303380 RepID=A0A4R6G6W2_9BURK|nr:class A beta-lactamase [Herminiimonas fonticola]RBA23094.1 Beta-lactamase class A [Herminiimonas fonticola]TDN89464.1 beta-lactamase class A [Herminiimonas fonticola]